MDFNDLYYFYLTAEHGGFTSAERISGVKKSLLSRRIMQLEEKLNVRLIQRNSRSFNLTAAGKILFEHAKEMVRDGQNAYESVSALVSVPSGVVRIACPTVLAQYHLASILPGFMARYPQVSVMVDATDRPVQVIEERFDLVLRARKSVDEEPGLIARVLAKSQLLLVASPEYLRKCGGIDSPEKLNDVCILSSVADRSESEVKWELAHIDGRTYVLKKAPALFCLNPGVQVEAAIHGIGIGLIPDTIAMTALKEGGLVHILKEWSAYENIIHAVFPSRKHMNPAVRVLLDYLIHHLPSSVMNIHNL